MRQPARLSLAHLQAMSVEDLEQQLDAINPDEENHAAGAADAAGAAGVFAYPPQGARRGYSEANKNNDEADHPDQSGPPAKRAC